VRLVGAAVTTGVDAHHVVAGLDERVHDARHDPVGVGVDGEAVVEDDRPGTVRRAPLVVRKVDAVSGYETVHGR
jgi:hypothetical protein